ncbi:hypothetical protein ASG68_26520 [Rhizobium sp. Leaf453]|nr:hypothetical protein ASG42_23675 [Rhizobium sp. Leaf391]KQU03573.1 hypothetical protein ASG68_26520 [Rhizobium sp. Leaf453]
MSHSPGLNDLSEFSLFDEIFGVAQRILTVPQALRRSIEDIMERRGREEALRLQTDGKLAQDIARPEGSMH